VEPTILFCQSQQATIDAVELVRAVVQLAETANTLIAAWSWKSHVTPVCKGLIKKDLLHAPLEYAPDEVRKYCQIRQLKDWSFWVSGTAVSEEVCQIGNGCQIRCNRQVSGEPDQATLPGQ
jgi:hypothetical protein